MPHHACRPTAGQLQAQLKLARTLSAVPYHGTGPAALRWLADAWPPRMANRLLKPRMPSAASKMAQTDVSSLVPVSTGRIVQPVSPRKNRIKEQPHPAYGVSQREVYDRMTTVEELIAKKVERGAEKEALDAMLADPAIEGPVKHHAKCEYILR